MKKAKDRIPGQRVAVVEEVADNIYSIKFILQSLGYEVGSFSFSDGYLQTLEGFQPELIIVDMMMPGRAGHHAIYEIKNGQLAKVPLLAITADAMEGDEQEVLEAGGEDVLAKPYSVSDLQDKVRQLLPSVD